VSVYKNNYENISQFLSPNGESISINGVEIAINKQWTSQFSTRVQYAYNNGDSYNYSFTTRSANIAEQISGAQLSWQITDALQTNLGIYYNTNQLPEINNNIYQTNTRLDMNIQYQLHPQLRLTLAGQNLLEDAESQVADGTRLNSGVERAIYLKTDWRW
jgi:outer membrane receptor for ferric coprogen and ferric-rhodotorulic acid